MKYAPLHYRNVEKIKSDALKLNKGNFEATCVLKTEEKLDLEWWKTSTLENWIHPPPITIEISTDACTGKLGSSGGWGAAFKEIKCGGAWSFEEQDYHINTRERLAIYYALRSLRKYFQNKHVCVKCDSTAAVGIVNKMGTSKNKM